MTSSVGVQRDLQEQYKKEISDKLRIGLLVPLSGPIKAVGEGIVDAVQLSIFDNKIGNVLLKVFDTKGTTFGAVEAMNKALESGIDVVIGPLFMAETKAIQSLAQKNDIILFSLSNEQSLANYDNIFVTGSVIEQEIQALVSYFDKNDMQNYVALLPNTSFGASVNRALRESVLAKDGLLIKTDYYDSGDKKLMAKINELISFYEVPDTLYEDFEKKKLEQKEKDGTDLDFTIKEEEKIYPQIIFIAEGGKNAEQVASHLFMLQQENKTIDLAGTTKLDGDDNVLFNPYMDGVIFPGANPKKYKTYSDKFQLIYHRKPLKITSMVYDLVALVSKFYKLEDGVYTPIREKLFNPKGFATIDGRTRFLPNGLVERKFYILQIENGEKKVLDTNQEFLNY